MTFTKKSKNKKVKTAMMSDKAPAIACLIVLGIIFWAASKAGGATEEFPLHYGGDYDHVRTLVYKHQAPDWNLIDSLIIQSAQFPLDTFASFDNSRDHLLVDWYTNTSCTDSVPVARIIKYEAGAATISSSDMGQMARKAADSVTADHGEGSYTTGGAGDGPYSVTIVTVDTAASDTVPVPYVSVIIRNAAQTTTPASGNTDINGELTVNLTADTHVFIATEVGYTWPTYDSHVVAGSQTDTIWSVRWIPDAPSDTFLCRLWGYIRDIESKKPYKANIIVTPKGDSSNTCDNVILALLPSNTQTDTAGYFEIDVLWSSCRGDGRYDILIKEARSGATIKSKNNYLVPDSSTHKLVF